MNVWRVLVVLLLLDDKSWNVRFLIQYKTDL